MTDDRDDEKDASEWLASQFDATGAIEKPKLPPVDLPVVAPTVVPPTFAPPTLVPPVEYTAPPVSPEPYLPPPLAPPAAAPAFTPATPARPVVPSTPFLPVDAPPAAAPAQPFSWGLKPGDPVSPPGVSPVVPTSVTDEPPTLQVPWQDIPTSEIPPAGSAEPAPPPAEPPVRPDVLRPPWETEAPPAPTAAFPAQDTPTTALAPLQPTPLPPLAPAPPTEPHAGQFPWETPPAVDSALEGATEVFAAQPVGLPEPVGEGVAASALDSLFGDTQFREYQDTLVPALPPRDADGGGEPPKTPKEKRQFAAIPRNQRILMWVAGSLVAVIALVALFFLGTRLTGLIGPAPAVSPSPSPSASPSPAPLGVGPVKPGEYHYDALLGGECLDPYQSPWQADYVVVDCAQPHLAQMIYRGLFADKENDPYPGVDELQKRINLLCTPATIINYAAAGLVPDLQVSASFAADEDQWDSGDRTYYCFVNRAGGAPITGTVAVPQVAPAPAG